MKTYREILKQSLITSWNNKYLWFFGLFAALFVGGEYEIITGSFLGRSQNFLIQLYSEGIFNVFNWGKKFIESPLVTSMFLIIWIFIFVLFLFLLWLSNVSRIAIVNNIYLMKKNEKNDFQSGIASGMKFFWPVFAMSVFLSFITSISLYLISNPLFVKGSLLSDIFLILFFVVVIAFVVVLSFIVKYAIAFIVIRGNTFKQALVEAVKLFKSNWLISLEMAFVLFLLNVAAAALLFVCLATIAVPSLFLAFMIGKISAFVSFALFTLTFIFLFIFIVVFGSVLSTFQISSWTMLFIELITGGAKSKLIRLFHKEK